MEIEKAFLSRIEDDVRLPFKRANEQIVRRAVFARSVNRKNVNNDASGSNRFCFLDLGNKKLKLPRLAGALDDKWAELVNFTRTVFHGHLTDEEKEPGYQAVEGFTYSPPLTNEVLKAAKQIRGEIFPMQVT